MRNSSFSIKTKDIVYTASCMTYTLVCDEWACI